MDRKEHLKFCQVCVKKEVSFEKGIICSLTGEHANFEKTCPDYVEDESLKKDLDFKKGKITKNGKSTAITLLIAGIVTIFIIPIVINKFGFNFNKTIVTNIIGGLFLIMGVISFLKTKDITTENLLNMKRVIFTIIGAILGLPLSYYFQPDMVQAKVGGIGGYIKNFGDILEAKDLISNVIMGVIVFAIIGFIIGYFMDKNASPKTD